VGAADEGQIREVLNNAIAELIDILKINRDKKIKLIINIRRTYRINDYHFDNGSTGEAYIFIYCKDRDTAKMIGNALVGLDRNGNPHIDPNWSPPEYDEDKQLIYSEQFGLVVLDQ